jgi:GT2 family glycosyltransferase
MLDIAIQIVNYNTKKYLVECIDGVLNGLKDSGLSYKILVLDNASQDNLSDLKIRYDERVEWYDSGKNLGFGGGHNLLGKKSSSDYILILNPDIRFIEKDTIKRIVESIKEKKNIAAVGPKLLMENNKPQPWDHGELIGIKAWMANHIGRSFWQERSKKANVAWVSGAFFLVRRDIFEKNDGFDEHFFLYKEEEDLCLRMRKKRWNIVYVPAVKVLHYGSVVASKDEYMPRSNEYFTEKHFSGKWYYPVLSWISRIVVK